MASREFSAEFTGNDRFRVIGPLGSGGMGVVYEVHDRLRGQRVALKTLKRRDPDAIYRFKREFRALADLDHPGLIKLHDLFVDEDQCFFTMELVRGLSFIEYVGVRPQGAGADDDTVAPGSEALLACEEDRLRAALPLLAQGLHALHKGGKIHRDVKPSNVLVTPAGRVLVLDFGLATEQDLLHESLAGAVVGTVAYMAPEQAAGSSVTSASDWYSVGVMLYQALTGRLPFGGHMYRTLLDKQSHPAPPPRAVLPDVPKDLDALCVDLMAREARDRPRGEDVLARLGMGQAATLVHGSRYSQSAGSAPYIGRSAALDELAKAYQDSRKGLVVAFVRGASGMGKSALLEHFVRSLPPGDHAVVLSARCYERESVPFKAIDGAIDALSRELRGLPEPHVRDFLPEDTVQLAQVFPVLRRVEPIAVLARGPAELANRDRQKRAFDALRALLAILAAERPVVLLLDDLQWADADSAALLRDVLALESETPLRMLAIAAHRDGGTSLALDVLGQISEEGRREVVIEPLDETAAMQLAVELLGAASETELAQARSLARASGGSPFLLDELVRLVSAGGLPDTQEVVTAADVILARVADLPEPAQRLLRAVAVAGGPVLVDVARRAAALEDGADKVVNLLRSVHLLRFDGTQVETRHDQIREALAGALSAEDIQNVHHRLAVSYAACPHPDPEKLAQHFALAGEPERALTHVLEAAEAANQSLAFDRAASLLSAALEGATAALRTELMPRLAEAVGNAGRSAEAARLYLQAAQEGGADPRAFRYKCLALDHLLGSGYVDEALVHLREVSATLGVPLASSPRLALVQLMRDRLRLRLRGLGYRKRAPDEVPARELARLDSMTTVATALGMFDVVRGSALQTSHLLLALRVGEERRICRALAAEAVFRASTSRAPERMMPLVERVEKLALRADDPYLVAWAHLARGTTYQFGLRYRLAAAELGKVHQILTRHGVGMAWERTMARVFASACLCETGAFTEAFTDIDRHMAEAERARDRYALSSWSWPLVWKHLVADDSEGAQAHAEASIVGWPTDSFYTQHFMSLAARAFTELYAGDLVAVAGTLDAIDEGFRSSLTGRITMLALVRLRLGGMMQAIQGDVSAMRQTARSFQRYSSPVARGFAQILLASCARREGNSEGAVESLFRARKQCQQEGLRSWDAAIARRLCGLVGGDAGRSLLEESDAYFGSEGIANPDAVTRLLVPGFDE